MGHGSGRLYFRTVRQLRLIQAEFPVLEDAEIKYGVSREGCNGKVTVPKELAKKSPPAKEYRPNFDGGDLVKLVGQWESKMNAQKSAPCLHDPGADVVNDDSWSRAASYELGIAELKVGAGLEDDTHVVFCTSCGVVRDVIGSDESYLDFPVSKVRDVLGL